MPLSGEMWWVWMLHRGVISTETRTSFLGPKVPYLRFCPMPQALFTPERTMNSCLKSATCFLRNSFKTKQLMNLLINYPLPNPFPKNPIRCRKSHPICFKKFQNCTTVNGFAPLLMFICKKASMPSWKAITTNSVKMAFTTLPFWFWT